MGPQKIKMYFVRLLDRVFVHLQVSRLVYNIKHFKTRFYDIIID